MTLLTKSKKAAIAAERKRIQKQVGLRIRAARKKSGKTLNQVAEIFGGSHQTIQHYERGRALPIAADMPRLAAALDTTTRELYGRAEAATEESEPDDDLVEILHTAMERALELIAERHAPRGRKSG